MMTQQEALSLFEYRDGNLYWKVQPANCVQAGSKAGVVRKGNGYVQIRYKRRSLMAHRIVFLMHHGYLPPFIDHINGNPQDNRIVNLREATSSQNTHNSKLLGNNTSGVKGVDWQRSVSKWRARVQANGKRVTIGFFETLEEARQAVVAAREQYHGDFARHI